MPISWFDRWRDQLIARFPALASVSHGSGIWWFSSRPSLVDGFEPESLAKWAQWLPEPRSRAGRRLVTLHGDIHLGNIIRSPNGLWLIDFEYTCVGCAALDFAYASWDEWFETTAAKRELVKAYLEGMGKPARPHEYQSQASRT